MDPTATRRVQSHFNPSTSSIIHTNTPYNEPEKRKKKKDKECSPSTPVNPPPTPTPPTSSPAASTTTDPSTSPRDTGSRQKTTTVPNAQSRKRILKYTNANRCRGALHSALPRPQASRSTRRSPGGIQGYVYISPFSHLAYLQFLANQLDLLMLDVNRSHCDTNGPNPSPVNCHRE